MSVSVDLKPMPDYLHATLSGDYTAADFNDALSRVFDAAHEHRQVKLLIDCRGVTGGPTLEERYGLGQFFADMLLRDLAEGRSLGLSIAAIATPPLAHPERIGIKHLVDRGLNVAIHETDEDARAWLGVV